MLGLRPAQTPRRSIRGFAAGARRDGGLLGGDVARGPKTRRRSATGRYAHPSPTTPPFHRTPPLPTPHHTLARGSGLWVGARAEGLPPDDHGGTTVRSAPPLPQPCQATPFPHAWLIALAVCAASDSGSPNALNVGGAQPALAGWHTDACAPHPRPLLPLAERDGSFLGVLARATR